MSISRFWKNIVMPGWYAIRKLGLLFIFLLLAMGAGLWAFLLQQVAFPQAGSSADQISATVYVQTLPAHVNLQSMFTPSAATNNVSFAVTSASATASPIAPACYTPASMSPDTTSVKYSFPTPANGTTVATSEVLNDVKLSNERIDSMYPQGVITTDEVTWTGSAGLSPSLSATNLASAERQNKDAASDLTSTVIHDPPLLVCLETSWQAS